MAGGPGIRTRRPPGYCGGHATSLSKPRYTESWLTRRDGERGSSAGSGRPRTCSSDNPLVRLVDSAYRKTSGPVWAPSGCLLRPMTEAITTSQGLSTEDAAVGPRPCRNSRNTVGQRAISRISRASRRSIGQRPPQVEISIRVETPSEYVTEKGNVVCSLQNAKSPSKAVKPKGCRRRNKS